MHTSIDFGARGGDTAIIEIDTRKQDKLARDFDEHLEFGRRNLLELGRIARELKPHHVTQGQRQKGKGWEAFLEERHLSRSTVDEWIAEYERSIGAREHKSVLPDSGRTNSENKEVSSSHNRFAHIEHNAKPLADSDSPSLEAHPETTTVVPQINPLDTPQGRSDWLFRNALKVFERANKASGQAVTEWNAAVERVRKVLASYKDTHQLVAREGVNYDPIWLDEEN